MEDKVVYICLYLFLLNLPFCIFTSYCLVVLFRLSFFTLLSRFSLGCVMRGR